MKWFLAAAVLVVAAGGCATADAGRSNQPATCETVLAEWRRAFPEIIQAAGSPSYSCIDEPEHGAGGYAKADSRIEINNAYSPEARSWGVTDKRRYLMRAIAHETGHAWAVHNNLEHRGEEFKAIRGYSAVDAADPITIQEDFAETFAFSLGWYQSDDECYAHVPYCWQLDAGKPTVAQIAELRAASLLPYSR